MLTGIVAAVGRIESLRPLGAPADADAGACVRLTVHAGGPTSPMAHSATASRSSG
ncbi:TPA: hypothetical protein QDB06_004704 [Burkholderia vietnamiensis]|nr:hypothetical protein [Burkholderia vietnamiensis]